MARKNDLAKLAALAGLGAYITNQYRNKVDLTEKDSNPDRKARPDSTENRLKPQAQSIAEADKSGKASTTTAGPAAPLNLNMPPIVKEVNKPKAEVSKVNKSETKVANNQAPLVLTEELKNLPVSESSKNQKARNLPLPIPNSMKNLVNVPTNFGKLVDPYPADNKAATNEAARQAAIEATKKHAEAQKALMAERQRKQKASLNMEDEIRNTMGSTMKRGGAVKMASGGMAASRRGDGIAQRGKTRGKMC